MKRIIIISAMGAFLAGGLLFGAPDQGVTTVTNQSKKVTRRRIAQRRKCLDNAKKAKARRKKKCRKLPTKRRRLDCIGHNNTAYRRKVASCKRKFDLRRRRRR